MLLVSIPLSARADWLEDIARPPGCKVATVPQTLLSLDRQTRVKVLLQKQAEPASVFLLQWLSGYASFFTMETNIDRAIEIRATLPTSMGAGTEPLRMHVNLPGGLAKLLGERVAANARQAGTQPAIASHPGRVRSDGRGAHRSSGGAIQEGVRPARGGNRATGKKHCGNKPNRAHGD